VLQGCVFGSTELGLSRITENFRYFMPFPRLDAVVEIFKEPIQPLPESAAHTAFPGSHETDQKNSVDWKTAGHGGRRLGPHTGAGRRIHRFARTLFQKISF
jgi:hypothetical protein